MAEEVSDVLPIVKMGAPVLVEKTKEFTVEEIKSDETKDLIRKMIATMDDAKGVGLAATQIGVAKRVCVIRIDEKVHVLFNPVVVEKKGKRILNEGCLSIPGRHGKARRSSYVRVEAIDENGRFVEVEAKDDLMAQALEHEIDHLDGILFIRRLAGSLKRERVRS